MTDDAPVGLKTLRPHVDYTPAHVTIRNLWHSRPIRVAGLAAHHPLTIASVVILGWLWWLSPMVFAALVVSSLAGTGALLHRHPEIHERHLRPRYRGFFRSFGYRYRWITALEDCHVVKPARPAPRLIRIHWSPYLDRLLVHMTGGMSVETFFESTTDMQNFAQTLGVREVRAMALPLDKDPPVWLPSRTPRFLLRRLTKGNVHRFELWMITGNALREPVAPYELSESDPLPVHGLPIARGENGLPWLLRYTHILLVGATRSGKSWFLWAIIFALYRAVLAGMAQLWVIDPKRHQLGIGRHLYHRFANAGLGSYVVLLEAAVEVLIERQDELDRLGLEEARGVPGMWQLWVIVDEILDLAIGPPKLVKRADAALTKLLREGAAADVFVVGATQAPEKALLKWRRWFVLRLCFRVTEAIHVRMALGDRMRERGALADEIKDNRFEKGVAYVLDDGAKNAHKIRGQAVGPEVIRGLPGVEGVGVLVPPPSRPELPAAKVMLELTTGAEPPLEATSMTLSLTRE